MTTSDHITVAVFTSQDLFWYPICMDRYASQGQYYNPAIATQSKPGPSARQIMKSQHKPESFRRVRERHPRRKTPYVAMTFLIHFRTIENRITIWRRRAFLMICADACYTEHLLHREIILEKRDSMKRGKSLMGRVEDVVAQLCKQNNIIPGAEWIQVLPRFTFFS